jgi:outer membrane protein insertion porin family
VIRGNQKTSDRVIRRELMLFEGDRYNETNYQASRARAMALGYFERVDLSTETVEGHPEWIQVNVEVVERPTGTFQVGAGFSSIETFIFTAQVQQLNLFGRGQSLTFQAQFSGLRQIFSLRFVEPYLWDSNWTGALDLYNTLRAYTDFTRNSTGGALTAGYPLIGLNDLRMFLTYTGEQVDVNTTRSGAIFGQTTAPSAFAQLPLARLFQSGFTSSLGLAFTVDTRDNRLFPSNGVYARVGVDVADSFLGSQNIYARWSGFFRFYTPIGPQSQGAQGAQGVVLKGNFNLGFVGSRDPRGVPIFERYFLGGILDVRGFNLRSIGPRLQLPQSFDPNSPIVATGAVIGGNLQMYYNLELEFPILNQVGLRGVIFQDAGNVFNTEAQFCNASGGRSLDPRLDVVNPCVVNPLALRYSWGFGLRWFSPLGLLRFEWGFPFTPLPFEQSSNFQFTIGNFF